MGSQGVVNLFEEKKGEQKKMVAIKSYLNYNKSSPDFIEREIRFLKEL
jgi:hypothetical protein